MLLHALEEETTATEEDDRTELELDEAATLEEEAFREELESTDDDELTMAELLDDGLLEELETAMDELLDNETTADELTLEVPLEEVPATIELDPSAELFATEES